jgi:hypothetical protein
MEGSQGAPEGRPATRSHGKGVDCYVHYMHHKKKHGECGMAWHGQLFSSKFTTNAARVHRQHVPLPRIHPLLLHASAT